jgi:hypothetical protein
MIPPLSLFLISSSVIRDPVIAPGHQPENPSLELMAGQEQRRWTDGILEPFSSGRTCFFLVISLIYREISKRGRNIKGKRER